MFVSSLKRIRFADYAPFRSRRNGGRFGISPPVGDAVGIEALLEAAHELGAVVFDSEARRLWQQLAQRVKGDGRLLAGLGGGEGGSEAGVRVDESEQAAAQSIAQAHHSVAGEHFKRWMFAAFGLAGFAVAGDEFVAAAGTQSGGGMAHFVWVAGDDAADGGDAGLCNVFLPTPGSQQDPQFGFAEVGELLAQLADFLDQRRGRLWLSPTLGGAGFGSQGGRVAAGLAHCFQR
ncbi:hypothetical protein [Candidatus Spongiihabitans sp.]|uniref:hypothetical protein n=1 Tax=Candidatus Spongiihabitans sp. TaxID=3101308 RepID=UPI003C6FB698